MKSPYVNELKPDQIVTTTFLVHSKEIRQKKSGELYLSLLLGDRTGEIDAKMWDGVAEAMDTFDRDDFVKIKGQLHFVGRRKRRILSGLEKYREGFRHIQIVIYGHFELFHKIAVNDTGFV